MQFKCNCCGAVVDVPQNGPVDGASCVEPSSPPKGWRAIWTMIEEYTREDGEAERYAGQALHSCPDCNAHMSVDEHLEAEFDGRERAMHQPEIERPLEDTPK